MSQTGNNQLEQGISIKYRDISDLDVSVSHHIFILIIILLYRYIVASCLEVKYRSLFEFFS